MNRFCLAFLLIFAQSGCKSRDESANSTSKAVGAEDVLRERPLSLQEFTTTNGGLFLSNYDARIESLKARLRGSGPVLVSCGTLASDLRTRGQYSENLPDFFEAEKLLDTCLQAGVQEKEIYLLRSVAYLALHKYDRAAVDIRTAFDNGLDENLYHFIRQSILWEEGKYAEAREIAVRAATKPSVTTLTRMGALHFLEGDFANGHKFFVAAENRMTEPNPMLLAWIYTQRGRAYISAGNADLALSFCSAALGRLPNFKIATECLAEAHAGKGEFTEAIKYFDELVHAVPPDLKATLKLAQLYDKQGTVISRTKAAAMKALAAPQLAILQVKAPEIFYGINAQVLVAGGLLTPARSLVDKAIGVSGINSINLQLRAELNLKDHKTAEAKADIEQALAMNPKSAGLHNLAATIFAATNEMQKAEDQKQLARSLNPHIYDAEVLWY